MAVQQQPVEYLSEVSIKMPPDEKRALPRDERRTGSAFNGTGAAGFRSAKSEPNAGQNADLGAGRNAGRGADPDATVTNDATITNCDNAISPGGMPGHIFVPGQLIAGRFVVVRLIARGGMGEVYEVKDQYLQGARVALKMILPEIAAEASASHRFEQEVLLARRVVHPNLCPIYDIFHCEEPPPPFLFLTMKYLDGETLASRLRKPGPMPGDEAVEMFRQLICGVAAIHAAGVIHRDIKPNNVMLDHSGTKVCVSIMDFGLARLHESETTAYRTGMVSGTPGYLAPELLRGHAPSQASDIYALGILLHQALAGERPLQIENKLGVRPSAALDAAKVSAIYIEGVREFLSEDPQRRTHAFAEIQSFIDSKLAEQHSLRLAPRLISRRSFVFASAATVAVAAGGAAFKHKQIYNVLHPLPRKRFVALLGFPPADARIKPMLMGLIDAMGNELARAEASDHDLFVIPHATSVDLTTTAQLNELRESAGANLVLATSGTAAAETLRVSLKVLDPSSGRTLRTKVVETLFKEQFSLPATIVRAAAELLDIRNYEPNDERSNAQTSNPDALAAYQSGEALMKEPNFTGVEGAIEKYRQAVDLDPRYAQAYARLSIAYLQFYKRGGDASSLALARANAETSLTLYRDLVEGHIALAWYFEETGDLNRALHEMGAALALDASDPRTLTYQGQIYSELNRWEDADKTFRRVLVMRPNYWLPYNELGQNSSARGNCTQALESFKTASTSNPRSALALNNIGAADSCLGRYDEALKYLSKSMSIEPNGDAASSISQVLRVQEKFPEALESGLLAVKLAPDDSTNWLDLGDCYTSMRGHAADAKSAYERAAAIEEEDLKTNPGDGPGWMRLALYQAKSGNISSVRETLKKAEALRVQDIYSQLNKASILELLGDRNDALATIASCMARGATHFQIESKVDLESLRKDPRYQRLAVS